MGLMIAGLLLWSVVHLVPSMGAGFKANIVGDIGEQPYKGLFSLLIALSLVLIVLGWRSTTPTYLYTLPAFVRPLSLTLLVIAFLLLGAARQPTRIKRLIRHTQLSGVLIWAVAHLLLNGDSRGVVLFGWLGSWALLEIFFINRRDGAWEKPLAPSWGLEIRTALVSLAVFALVIFLHPYIAGVPVR